MIEFVMSCWDDEAGIYRYLIFSFPLGCVVQPARIRCASALRVWTKEVLAGMLILSFLWFAGGFGAHPDHDAHLLSTLSAIQILIMQDALDRMDVERVVKCASLFPLP